MQRTRTIKPSFFMNEEIGSIPPIERLALIGIWSLADANGRLEFRPKRLKAQLFPYDDCDFEIILQNLSKAGCISINYEGNVNYIEIINFEEHVDLRKTNRGQ